MKNHLHGIVCCEPATSQWHGPIKFNAPGWKKFRMDTTAIWSIAFRVCNKKIRWEQHLTFEPFLNQGLHFLTKGGSHPPIAGVPKKNQDPKAHGYSFSCERRIPHSPNPPSSQTPIAGVPRKGKKKKIPKLMDIHFHVREESHPPHPPPKNKKTDPVHHLLPSVNEENHYLPSR